MGKRLVIFGADFSANGIYGGTPDVTVPSTGGGSGGSSGNNSLPAGYTRLSYLESDGNSWIDTGYIYPGGDFRLQAVFQRSGFDNAYLCGCQGDSCRVLCLGLWKDNGGQGTYFTMGDKPIYQGLLLAPTSQTQLDVDLQCSGMTVSGTCTGTDVTPKTFTGSNVHDSLTLAIFRSNPVNQSFMAGKLYSFKLTVDSTPVMDLVPCISPQGFYGVYDKVRNCFLGNSGSGTFTGA